MRERIRYAAEYNPIIEYYRRIESGEELVSAKVAAAYKKLASDCLRPDGEWYYSPRRGNHVLEFAENYCRHSKGKFAGHRVELELWEKALLAAMFGFTDINGCRKYREVLLLVAKKNGKSLLSSVVGNYLLLADGEGGPEVYAVATKKDQAKIVWGEAKRMIKKSPSLSKRVRTLVAELVSDFNDGVFKPLASDTDTLDGLNVHGALMDEIHQWKQGRALYDIIVDGMVGREQPLAFLTSTAGTVREDIYDDRYEYAERVINGWSDADPDAYRDERFLPIIYELDSKEEWTRPECWKKANPGLGTIKPYASLAEKVERAKANPALVKNLVCKDFNIPETSSESWLTWEQCRNEDTFELELANKRLIWHHKNTEGLTETHLLPYPRYGIAGADLSSTTDLTAAKVIFRVPGCDVIFVLSMYWIAAELLETRVNQDQIPYDKWHERGLVRLSPGNRIDYHEVTAWFREVQEELDIYIFDTGYDAWSAEYWVREMTDFVGPGCMTPVRQGKQTLSNPMKCLGNDLITKQVVYNNNPVDRWCLYNTSYDEDKNGNIQPHKTSRATRRIDGTAALLDAYVVYQNRQEEYLSLI